MLKRIIFLFVVFFSVFYFTNVYADEFTGEYSLDYLLRNYQMVSLGMDKNDSNSGDFAYEFFYDNASVQVQGAVLINGNIEVDKSYDYIQNYELNIGTQDTNTKSFVKENIPDHVNISNLETSSNYIDFEKMYTNVVNESNRLAENTDEYINSSKIEISHPGIYTIRNTSLYSCDDDFDYFSWNSCDNNTILIKNYDKNSLYVFNYYNEYIYGLPSISIMEEGSSNSIPLIQYLQTGNYKGNIVFNFPIAKEVSLVHLSSSIYFRTNPAMVGSIVAPKAKVIISEEYSQISSFFGNVIANSIEGKSNLDNKTYFRFNYGIGKKVVDVKSVDYLVENKDYEDDYYSRDYSISDLLTNYSLITLGKKTIDDKSKLLNYGNTPGSVKLFHITGQALISGDLYAQEYYGVVDDTYNVTENAVVAMNKFDRVSFDLESNEVTTSYVRGSILKNVHSRYIGDLRSVPISIIQPWDNMNSDTKKNVYQKNTLIVSSVNGTGEYDYYGMGNFTGIKDNYINFDRLYDNVVSEQKEISCGDDLKVGEDGVVHIPIGGNYTIEDISNVKEVVFDNFEKNKDKLTIITIKNDGDINFPLISKSGSGYKGIVTNDYYGKEEATHLYEMNTFLSEDSYHGNIVWNVPNATYIKLKENAPFAGHLIAPNADVDTPETHFAGCFIVNSIYGEGNTEAHFYPITVKLECDCDEYKNLDSNMKRRFTEYRLRKVLGGDGSTVETNVIGDEVQYRKDMETFEHVLNRCPSNNSSDNPIVDIITNPDTYRNIGIVLVIVFISLFCILYKNKEKGNSI